MASAGLIAGILLAGGVGYLVWRARQKSAPKGPSACDSLCTVAGDPGGHAVCVAGCELAGGVLGKVNPFHDSTADWTKTTGDRDATNKQLNGAVELPLPLAGLANTHYGVEGTVARFVNGCTPFQGSPGWSKCKPGTASMWTQDVAIGTGNYDATAPNYAAIADHVYWTGEIAGAEELVNADAAQSFRGTDGDFFTRGPFPWPDSTSYTDGARTYKDAAGVDKTKAWLDRGKVLRCPAGQAPDDVVKGQAGKLGTPGVCVAYGDVSGTNVGGDCPAAGYTWRVGANGPYVAPLRAGETQVCKSQLPNGGTEFGSGAQIYNPLTHGIL